eukprot:TRINITY_DN35945_c0_g1_i1.p1 TRINITY_DN35945_c0_g1~~TRINITY_DN35945_c0_g1_i1.p1  ORF type:complete len:203 (-),score=29.55 TRINITY_DN35945_c0_g1_i1:260-847(-)
MAVLGSRCCQPLRPGFPLWRHGRLLRASGVAAAVMLVLASSLCISQQLVYVPPSKAELVHKSDAMMTRVKQVADLEDKLIPPETAYKFVEKGGALLIDVRTKLQIMGQSKGITFASALVNPLDKWITDGVPPSSVQGRTVILGCTSGLKSTLAWEFLQELDDLDIDAYVIDGGFEAWRTAGLPTDLVYLGSRRSA